MPIEKSRGIGSNIPIIETKEKKTMENINNDELDLVTFSDEEGNEFQMEVWDYFEHEGQEYAILFDLESEQDEDAETEVYIMKVTVEGEDEIFLPADEDKMDELTEIVEKMLDETFCDEDCANCDQADCEDRK